jgi:WD40 repeat protein
MKSPFKFLDSYTREDRAIFFGRDQEITDLYRRVFESKMLLVYGISGTGKSSLVNCGLASRFDESDWLPVNVRRGSNIVDSLNDAFNKQALTSLKKNQSTSEKLQSIYLDHFKPVYLLFDQFEELFIFGSQEEKEGFISIVKEITESETQSRIIFIIREEFLAGMTEFEEKLPDIFTNRFRVEKMKRTNAISAVEGPCKVFGIETESGFSEELIDKLCPAGNEIELTYLQIYLDRIFRLATNEQPGTHNPESGTFIINFSKELLSKAGSVSDLLGQFLDEQIREMDDPETGLAILKSFVSVQGTRRQMTEKEIQITVNTFGTNITEQELTKYLIRFVGLRLLRERDEAGHFELRHDSLASKLYEKFSALEKDIIEVKQFIENEYSGYEKRGKLLTAEDLKYIAPYEDKLILSKSTESFINKSKSEITRSRRRRRVYAGIAVIALVVILTGFTIWAMNERGKAVEQSRIAEEQEGEAIKARDEAITAQNEANRSKQEAVLAKDEALSQKSLADSALIIAENQRRISEQQRQRAEYLFTEANDQRQLAQETQKRAEQSAREVIETNRRAMYQLYLFNAKEFANKSLLLEKNDTMKALLALNAFDLVNYGFNNYASAGDTLNYEIVILEALQKAYLNFEPDTLISGEIWAIDSQREQIIFSNDLGQVLITRLEEQTEDKLPRLHIVETIKFPENSFIRSIAVDSLKGRIACGTSDGKVILITKNNSGESEIKEIYKHDERVLSLAFVPGKNRLVSTSLDRTIRIWDINSGSFIRELQVKDITKNLILRDNDHIFFTDDKGGIFNWDLTSLNDEPVLISKNDKPVNALAFNAMHNWLAASSYGQIMMFLSVPEKNGDIIPEFFPVNHTGTITSLKFSPDNRWLSSASLDGAVMLWDMNIVMKNEIANIVPVTIEHKNLNVLSLIFDIEGKYLIFGDNSNLHITPVGLDIVYSKLSAKMGNRTIHRNEWEYYIRGDISFESRTVK